jgi:hypothetical protein
MTPLEALNRRKDSRYPEIFFGANHETVGQALAQTMFVFTNS